MKMPNRRFSLGTPMLSLSLLAAGCSAEPAPENSGVVKPAPAPSTATLTGEPPASGGAAPAPGADTAGGGAKGVPVTGVAGPGPQKPIDASPARRMEAYERGLAFLRSIEFKDGGWGPPGYGAEPGVTALVLVSFLKRPGGAAPEDEQRIARGIAFLLSKQKEDGGIYETQNANYTTCIAVEALATLGDPAHAPAMEKALAFIRRMQFSEAGGEGRVVDAADPRYGGIGYGSDHTRPDLSNTQFAADSLRAAGVPATDPALQRMVTFLNRTQNRRENETEGEPREWKDKEGRTIVRSADGGGVYGPGDSKAGTIARPDGRAELRSYGSMTYALLKCYIHAGVEREDPRVKDAVKWIRLNYTFRENPGFDTPRESMQGYFYYVATAARALSMLGEGAAGNGPDGKPRDWRADLARELIRRQLPEGGWVNSNDRWMEPLPPVATAFALKAIAETIP